MVTTTFPTPLALVPAQTRPETTIRLAGSTRDPLARARESLHAAARLPFATGQPAVWRSRFAHHVETAKSALREYIVAASRSDSPISVIEREEPRLRAIVQRQRSEHAGLIRQARSLSEEAHCEQRTDIWRMIDLGEKAALLELALSRHYKRLVELVYEATNRELGGESG